MRLYSGRTTLSKFVIEHCHDDQRELAALLIDVAAGVKAISAVAGKGALGGGHGLINNVNVQGEAQHGLDVLANEIFIDHCDWNGLVAGMRARDGHRPVVMSGGEEAVVRAPGPARANTARMGHLRG